MCAQVLLEFGSQKECAAHLGISQPTVRLGLLHNTLTRIQRFVANTVSAHIQEETLRLLHRRARVLRVKRSGQAGIDSFSAGPTMFTHLLRPQAILQLVG